MSAYCARSAPALRPRRPSAMAAKSCSPHRRRPRPTERSGRSKNAFHRPPSRPFHRPGLNSPFFHPKEQYHQSPQMIAQVGTPVEMSLQKSFNSRELKEFAMFSGRERHGFLEQRPERSAEPVVGGNRSEEHTSE